MMMKRIHLDYENVLFHNKQFKLGHVFTADPPTRFHFWFWSVIWVSLKSQWWRPQSPLGSATVHVPNVYSYFFNCFIIYNVDDKACVMCPKLILNFNYLFHWNLSTRTTGQCHTFFSPNLTSKTYQSFINFGLNQYQLPVLNQISYLHAFQPTISFTTAITCLELTVMFI